MPGLESAYAAEQRVILVPTPQLTQPGTALLVWNSWDCLRGKALLAEQGQWSGLSWTLICPVMLCSKPEYTPRIQLPGWLAQQQQGSGPAMMRLSPVKHLQAKPQQNPNPKLTGLLPEQVQCFGLAMVRLDIRQESTRHSEAIAVITKYLGIGDYKCALGMAWHGMARPAVRALHARTAQPWVKTQTKHTDKCSRAGAHGGWISVSVPPQQPLSCVCQGLHWEREREREWHFWLACSTWVLGCSELPRPLPNPEP